MTDCCSTQISCCCGSSPASLCCSPLPAVKQSLSTCIMYSMFLLLAISVSCLMQTPELKEKMKHVNNFNETCVMLRLGHNCESTVGYMAVYRVGFTMVIFHLLLLISTLGVSTGHGLRAGIHNGYWFFKFLIIIVICFASFYIPSERIYSLVWMYVGMIGGFLFIILQLVLLVDFAHSWNSKWTARALSGNGKPCWKIALYACSILLVVVTAGCTLLLYYYYARPAYCKTNKILIGSSAAICLLLCLISVLPCIRMLNKNSGLLQGCVMSAYIMYLTWTAVTSEPPQQKLDWTSVDQPWWADESTTYDSQKEFLYCCPKPFTRSSGMLSAYIGVAIVMVMAIFASVRTSRKPTQLGITVNQAEDSTQCCCCCRSKRSAPTEVRGGQRVIHDEEGQVVYSYAFFHFIFCLANLYIMMQITMWYKPRGTLRYFGLNWPSVWVKMASAWTCVLVYLWTLAIPTCIPGRDFSLLTGTLSRPRRESGGDGEEREGLRSPSTKGTVV